MCVRWGKFWIFMVSCPGISLYVHFRMVVLVLVFLPPRAARPFFAKLSKALGGPCFFSPGPTGSPSFPTPTIPTVLQLCLDRFCFPPGENCFFDSSRRPVWVSVFFPFFCGVSPLTYGGGRGAHSFFFACYRVFWGAGPTPKCFPICVQGDTIV